MTVGQLVFGQKLRTLQQGSNLAQIISFYTKRIKPQKQLERQLSKLSRDQGSDI